MLIFMTDDLGREAAIDSERIEMVTKVLDGPSPGEPRTYLWQVHMRNGSKHCFPMVDPAETLLHFLEWRCRGCPNTIPEDRG